MKNHDSAIAVASEPMDEERFFFEEDVARLGLIVNSRFDAASCSADVDPALLIRGNLSISF